MFQTIDTPVSKLKPNPRNARTHSKKQIRQIAESIKQFGFVNPVITDEQGMIIAGHGRLEAALMLELNDVPVITNMRKKRQGRFGGCIGPVCRYLRQPGQSRRRRLVIYLPASSPSKAIGSRHLAMH